MHAGCTRAAFAFCALQAMDGTLLGGFEGRAWVCFASKQASKLFALHAMLVYQYLNCMLFVGCVRIALPSAARRCAPLAASSACTTCVESSKMGRGYPLLRVWASCASCVQDMLPSFDIMCVVPAARKHYMSVVALSCAPLMGCTEC